MSTFLKIKNANLSQLNNAEYINFMRRFRAYLPLAEPESDIPSDLSLQSEETLGAPALGISAAQVTELDGYLEQLTELNNQSRINKETAERADIDNQRDLISDYILKRITDAATLPLMTERDAGILLSNVVKPYNGMKNLPQNQETETIKGFLVDLRKTDNATAVETLGLNTYLNELESLNNRYESLTAQRATSLVTNAIDNSKTVRTKSDSLYEDMTDLAFAYSLAVPSETATTFIKNLNALIDEAQTAVKKRRSKKGSSGSGSNTDQPGEL